MVNLAKAIYNYYKNLINKLVDARDINEIRIYETKLIGAVIAPMLLIAAFVNILIGIFWNIPIEEVLTFFTILLCSGTVILLLNLINLPYRLALNINSGIILFGILSTYYFYFERISILFWFILLIISLAISFTSDKTPMIYLTLAYIIIFALSTYNNPIKEIKLDITFYVILFIILLFYLVTSYVVNYLYHMVIKKKNDQYEDINGQNEEISALYEEIIASEDVLKEQNDQLIELNREITKNRDKLEFLAYNDTLTGLPNRKMINEQLELLINYGEKNNSFSLVFIDIDNFKRINDSMGHTSGDDLLIKVAKRCQEYIDNKDLFGRLGGDELSILVRRHLDDEELFQYIQSICNLFEEPFIIDDIEVRITASFGIAVWPTDALTAVELLKASDTAMYKAKETGKNNVQFYRKDMKTEILSKLEMENKMIKALKENQFFLEYQPLFDINTKKVRCFEALIRWELPEIGRISPMDFIPFAEENGFIHEIGEWVLRDVSKKIRDIKSYYKEDISIAVNISTIQLKSFNFIERLEQIIIEEDINPKDIELEITESVLIEDKYQAIEVINKLRNLGFKISMDDFGTGYSSLSYLLELPIDKLKIDKSFIDAISVGNKKNEIVGAIVEMVHSLDMEVVAEGVETEGQFRYLKKKNCDIVQGYLLGRPLNDDKMKELLLNNNIGI